MGYGGGGGGGGGSGGGGGGGGGAAGGGGGYRTVGGGSAFGGSDEQELPSYNQAPAGSIRFNTDSKKLEVYILGPVGVTTLPNGIWMEIDSWSPDLLTGGTRALLVGGYHPGNQYLDEIVYINLATTGNSQTFGELTVSDRNHVHGCVSDRTRGLSAGGSKAPGVITADIEYVTIASTGDAVDFGGDLTLARYCPGVAANSTRGVFAGGNSPASPTNTNIDYVTIQSQGDANDFGDLTSARRYIMAAFSSPTRGVFAGGGEPGYTTNINFITMSTQGNAAYFGDLSVAGQDTQGSSICSNSIRGINMGGGVGPSVTNTIEYLTLSTLGNAQDFGDLLSAGGYGGYAASSTRAVKMGNASLAYTDTIEYLQIMTLGDSVDFGNIHTQVTGWSAGLSNGHGGL